MFVVSYLFLIVEIFIIYILIEIIILEMIFVFLIILDKKICVKRNVKRRWDRILFNVLYSISVI